MRKGLEYRVEQKGSLQTEGKTIAGWRQRGKWKDRCKEMSLNFLTTNTGQEEQGRGLKFSSYLLLPVNKHQFG